MKSLAEGLPVDIAQQIHPDWSKNEKCYWAMRDQLLVQYMGKWIGFADGRVVTSGTRPVTVYHAAHELTAHPFVTLVGQENAPFRLRRATFAYDASYAGEPLPVINP